MKPGFRVFVSAVSSELGSYRREVARVLRRRELEVRDQEHFRQGGDTLLEQLRDYIERCDVVVLLVGERCGAFPTEDHAAALGRVPSFEAYRNICGQHQASYTQWEFFLAKHYGKKTYVFMTEAKDFVPDSSNPENLTLQSCQNSYRGWIKRMGEHREALTTASKLVEDVLVLPFPDLCKAKPIALPYPSLGSLFKGRSDVLELLYQSFEQTAINCVTAIVGKALHGLGGVGKTRLAVEYAWRHVEDYNAILFVRSDTLRNLRSNLAALAGPQVLDLPEQQAPEEEARVVAVLRWLHEYPGWLLILDNADGRDAAHAAEELLKDLHGGHVLITSRLSQWSGCVETLELDVLQPDDATCFLMERTSRMRRQQPTDENDADALARELGGLALALEQAGAHISYRRCSIADYTRDWRAQLPAVQEWHDPRLMKYPCSVAVTWQTTINMLRLGEIAHLRLLAWFAADPIPFSVINGVAAEDIWHDAVVQLSDEIRVAQESPGRPLDALAELANFSMVQWDADAQNISVHRVVQEIIRTRIPKDEKSKWLTLSLRLLDVTKPGNPQDVRTWPLWESLRPHIALCVAMGDQVGIQDPTATLMNDLSRFLFAKALYVEAEPVMRRVLAIYEKCFGPEHPEIATALTNLAQLLQSTNRLAEAEPLMRRVVGLIEKRYGKKHPIIARALSNLAMLLLTTNRLAEAETLMRRVLALDEKCFGPEHPEVANDLNNLSQLLKTTNRLAEAEPLMRRALAIYEKSFGPEHPDVATALNNLAQLLRISNQLAEAESDFRRALAIDEKSFGPEHPKVAGVLSNLAMLFKSTNRLGEAEPLMRRALEIDEKSFGPEHFNVARSLNNLAQLLEATNRLAEAEPFVRRALAIYEKSFGPEHPDVAIALNNLAQLLNATNRLAEAEPLMRRVVIIFEKSLGGNHPKLATALNNLAGLLLDLNRPAEAEPLMRRALKLDEKSFGLGHTDVAIDLNNLAQLLKATNRLAEAEPINRRAVRIFIDFTRHTGGVHHHFRVTLKNYTSILSALGRTEEDIASVVFALMAE